MVLVRSETVARVHAKQSRRREVDPVATPRAGYSATTAIPWISTIISGRAKPAQVMSALPG